MATRDHPKRRKSASALERRRFILERANARGQVSFDEIKEMGKERDFSAGWQSLKGDDELFDKLNLGIRLAEGEAKFVLKSRDILSTYTIREAEDKEGKRAIGQFGGVIVWGTQSAPKKGVDLVWPSAEAIDEQLSRRMKDKGLPSQARESADQVLSRLHHYWRKQNRYAALDAGTTTAAVARYLVGRTAPDAEAGIASLTILTNAPKIEDAFHEPSTSTDVIVLGGLLRKDTIAHTGLLCEQALEAWQIRLDLAMVGTTSLTTSHNREALCFTCDSPDEARTKAVLLERADMRCVVMSSSKCARYRSSAFVFASASPEFVDLIITDEGIEDAKNREVWNSLCTAGVTVLIARPRS